MSRPATEPCGICGKDTSGVYDGLRLCAEHVAVLNRVAKLKAAQKDPTVDLTGSRSHGPRDSRDGGFRRTFDVVPEDSLEQVAQDVTVTFSGVPFWAVETLFHRVHNEMGKADLDGWDAKLIIKYSNLDEAELGKLRDLRELLWTDFEIEVTKTRLYPPRHLAEQRLKEVEEERRREASGGGQGE